MAPDMTRQLPAGYALVIRGSYAPIIAKLPMCWNDRAYRRARRAGQAIAVLTPVAERVPFIVPPEFLSDDPLEPAVGALPRRGRYPWDDDLEP
jgi:hypothetical protein